MRLSVNFAPATAEARGKSPLAVFERVLTTKEAGPDFHAAVRAALIQLTLDALEEMDSELEVALFEAIRGVMRGSKMVLIAGAGGGATPSEGDFGVVGSGEASMRPRIPKLNSVSGVSRISQTDLRVAGGSNDAEAATVGVTTGTTGGVSVLEIELSDEIRIPRIALEAPSSGDPGRGSPVLWIEISGILPNFTVTVCRQIGTGKVMG